MNEVEIMNWIGILTALAGAVAAIGAVFGVLRDSQRIKDEHSKLSQDHKDILSTQVNSTKEVLAKQGETSKEVTQIAYVVGSVKENLDKAQDRIERLDSSEKQVQTAIDVFSKFLGQSHQEKREYYELQRAYEQLQFDYDEVVEEKEKLEAKLLELRPPERTKNRGMDFSR